VCYFLNLSWSGFACRRSISELCGINLMLERDAHVYAYQLHHRYLHALILSFALSPPPWFREREREREREMKWTHVLQSCFIHKKSLLLLCMLFFLSEVLNKNHKNILVTNSFILFWKLTSCGYLTNNIVSWGRENVILQLQVVRRGLRNNHLFFPQEFDMNPRVTLVRNFFCCITLHLESQQVIFKKLESRPSESRSLTILARRWLRRSRTWSHFVLFFEVLLCKCAC
jgi:hypothetical protein